MQIVACVRIRMQELVWTRFTLLSLISQLISYINVYGCFAFS